MPFKLVVSDVSRTLRKIYLKYSKGVSGLEVTLSLLTWT